MQPLSRSVLSLSFEVDPYFPHEFPIYKLRNTSKQFCDIPSYPHMSYTWMPNATCTAWRANVLLYAIFLPAACNCRTGKLHYSLLLTASLQSPRGVADVQANCALTPLIYTAQDHSTAQVRPPECQSPRKSCQVASPLSQKGCTGISAVLPV